MLDAKALEAARAAYQSAIPDGAWHANGGETDAPIRAAITAYLQAVGPEPAVAVRPLVEQIDALLAFENPVPPIPNLARTLLASARSALVATPPAEAMVEADHGAVKAAEDADKIVANLYAAEADKARLSEALRPFAAITEVPALGSITVDMVRDARAALSGSGSSWREPEPIKEVKALRQALLECRERAETGGRRIETAMDACEDISEIATCALPPEGWQGPAAPQQGGE